MAGQRRDGKGPSPTIPAHQSAVRRTIRGRERERKALLGLLATAEAGRPGVLLVDGEPGSGKSLLIGEAVRTAAEHGLPSITPEGPVLPDRREPALVSLDDLQWADPATLAALRRLGRRPLAWLLARRTPACADASGRLFDLMEDNGAARCVLTPLGDDAMAEIVIDLLGARPDACLADLAAGAGGNPALLTDLLTGLLEEGRIQISGGRARLSSVRLPDRLRATVRRRLDDLGPRTRRLLTVAAVLGRSFSPDDAAEILGLNTGAVFPDLDEALSAGILTATPDSLCFRHDLVRRVAAEAVPVPVRRALHRQAGELLIRRRGSVESAASHLMLGATANDARGLAGLDRAVDEVRPCTAADLASHALTLTAPDDPKRPARTIAAVRALLAAGRVEDAESVARQALSDPMPPVPCARLRCLLSEILRIRDRPCEAMAEAETVLSEPCLPEAFRDEADLALLTAQAAGGDDTRARGHATAVVSSAAGHNGSLVTAALIVLARAEWDAGHLAAGLGLARAAVRRAAPLSAGPRMTVAMLLAEVHCHDEARALIASAGEQGGRTRPAGPAAVRARLALAEGRFADAEAEARTARNADPHAAALLALAAFRTGDVNAARRHLTEAPPSGPGHARAELALVAAQIAEARDGPNSVRFRRLYVELLRHSWPLVRDPAAAAWLTRTALALGERPRAHAIVTAAERLAGDNAGFPGLSVAALHARGLLDRDARALEHAAAEHMEPWARASAAEDLAGLAATPVRAVEILDVALAGYEAIGAARDAARVRRRLRRLGVRRRHGSRCDRPVSGWGSLTDAERDISELVAQGLTNRQVADQLFMSVHTVAFHLRHVFRKLEVGSRVELTRLMLERGA